MNYRLQICADPQELANVAAEKLVQLSLEAIAERGMFTMALSGGSTPKILYGILGEANRPFRSRVPWDNTHFFWTDERHVPPDHSESNYRTAYETMLSRISVPGENVHRISGELANAEEAAHEYEQTLRRLFRTAADATPRFDLVLLGLGPDGHTASLFPYSSGLHDNRLVTAPWVERLQSFRVTLTFRVLNNARSVIFLVSGTEKAEAVQTVLEGKRDLERLPAQSIELVDGELTWLVDRAAAARLKTPGNEAGGID